MLKTFNFLTIAFLYLFSLCNNTDNKIQKSQDTSFTKNIEKVNFSGTWNYEFNSDENELLNKTFELNLVQNNDIIKGQYCAVAKGGRKIDCNDNKSFNITGKIKDKIAYVDFTGFYDPKSKGKAKLYFDNGNLVWEILSVKGEVYAPKKVILKNDSKAKNSIEGLYVLKSCENSRFKVKIEKKDSDFFYFVFDKNKIILKGKASITKNQISLGKMGGELSENTLVIQNTGNSMNEYNHFTQCDEKYLSFIKN
ncbi:hypothetical protein [Flavobacterium sp.]|uniref:hypothetical protein n=1 Tax=Flavobacterium sp. TaxID=239 RepID=UPI00286C535E|nr:hypothetical protein [Flavobacterium sp.]